MDWLLYLAIVIGVLTRDVIVRVVDASTAPPGVKVAILALIVVLLIVVAVLATGHLHLST